MSTAPLTLADDRYTIESVLGIGGVSIVFLATDNRLEVQRALKMLRKPFVYSPQIRTRFKNEAFAQAELRHPHILMVHDVVEEEDLVFLVMELAEGGSLAHRIQAGGPLSPRETAEVGVTISAALEVAHAAGVIHRDIKPDNILMDRHGTLKLADFGIARVMERDAHLTQAGAAMGTWAFMPPEQHEDASAVDARADIYALGSTLYHLATGESPIGLHDRDVFLDLPEPLADVIWRATRLDPNDRYARCADLAAELEEHLESLPGPSLVARTEPVSSSEQASDLTDALMSLNIDTELFSRAAPATAVPHPDDRDLTYLPEADEFSARPPPTRWPLGITAAVALAVSLGIAVGVVLALNLFGGEPGAQPDPPELSDASGADAPEVPPDDAIAAAADGPEAAEDPTEDPAPEASEPEDPAPTPVRVTRPPPRVITIGGARAPSAPDDGSASEPADPDPAETTSSEDAADPGGVAAPTGTLLLRTVPSGATLRVAGAEPPRAAGGGYALAEGNHLLHIQSPGGETTRIPVQIRADAALEICYNFDTNSACGGT